MSRTFRLVPPKLRETHVVGQVLDLLRLRGYYPLRLQSGFFRTKDGRGITVGEPGIPDYVAIHERYPAVFLEVKRPGGKLRDDQCGKIAELELWRLAVAVVDSAEALIAFLNMHEHTAKQQPLPPPKRNL